MGKAAKRKAGRYGLINPKKKHAPVLDLLPLDKLEMAWFKNVQKWVTKQHELCQQGNIASIIQVTELN